MRHLLRWQVLFAVLLLTAFRSGFAQGTWQALVHQPPWAPSTLFLLTDGTILLQRDHPNGTNWAKLTPDINGSYMNGIWSTVASSHYSRLYYASGVLADGRLIVAGGEYSSGGSETTRTEIYDPVANVWSDLAAPAGWPQIGDAPCAVLQDGRFFLGAIADNRTAFWNPATGVWTAGPNKLNTRGSEESWTLMPDNSIVTADCFGHPNAERWLPSTNTWVSAGVTVPDLVLPNSFEIGAGLTLTDGRAFYIGATPHTSIYTQPPIPTGTGSWVAGPDFPLIGGRSIGAEDAPAALLPNGHVIVTASPVTAGGGSFESPTYFFEYNGTTMPQIAAPPNSSGPAFIGRMMITPNGELLYSANGQIQVFVPSTGPNPAWRPTITFAPGILMPLGTYPLQGTQFNGLSQCVGYGDDSESATNYPIVRIRNNRTGHVFYCRTFNHSTMGIATGAAIVGTNFKVPASVEPGPSVLEVVANGISSAPRSVKVLAKRAP